LQADYTCPRGKWLPQELAWVRTAELVQYSIAMAPLIPRDITAVACIPRSGMIPSAILASVLHLPVYAVSNNALVPITGGSRASKLRHSSDRLVWVDDSVGRGTQYAMLREQRLIRSHDFTTAVFGGTDAEQHVDLCMERIPAVHLLEWNLFNGPTITHAALDLDGIVCADGDATDYSAANAELFFDTVSPLHVPRNARFRPKAIVTARPEQYRAVTQAWLDRHNTKHQQLFMWPYPSESRTIASVGEWKAIMCRKLDADFYVESDPYVADEMRKHHVRVLCPAQGVLR